MTVQKPASLDRRILLRTATPRDAVLAAEVLERAGFDAVICPDSAALAVELARGGGVLLVAEEILADADIRPLVDALQNQPPWSDIPVLVLARTGADSPIIIEVMELLANVTVIERPLRVAALVSTVRSALRARLRQYEMRALLESLREDDQRKTEFLATLAHELRNPLSPLSTALAMLSQMDVPPEEAKGFYQMMERQVDHMVRLIDDLMEVSRITRGKIELRPEPLQLGDVLAEAVDLARPQFEGAGHALEVRLPDGRCPLLGDRVRLTQVFANLLNNAAKYTPSGGTVIVDANCEHGVAIVRVRDNGIGVAPEMLSQIFGMFVQVSGAARAAQGGLGIGLTLVKTLVEMHGGRVHALSDGLGRGTEIVVELPIAEGATARADGAGGSGEVSAGALPGPILVVDDNEDAANSLAMYLDAVGAATDVAYDGTRALELVEAHRPPIAILDIGMPGMDGCELAQRLRSDPRNAGMTLIALTGWGQADDRARVSDAGFDHHLLKPPDISQLMALLQSPRD